jgi:hypothetical protein
MSDTIDAIDAIARDAALRAAMQALCNPAIADAIARRSAEGAAIIRLIHDLAPLADARPSLLDRIDGDALLQVLADAIGCHVEAIH